MDVSEKLVTRAKAAELLGISIKDVEELERQEILRAIRREGKTSFFTIEHIARVKSGKGSTLDLEAAQVGARIEQDTVSSLSTVQKILVTIGVISVGYLAVLCSLFLLFILNPLQTSDSFGYFYRYNTQHALQVRSPLINDVLAAAIGPSIPNETSIFADVLKPIAATSLIAVKAIDNQKYLDITTNPVNSNIIGQTGNRDISGANGINGQQGSVGTSGVNGTKVTNGTSGTSFADAMTTIGDIAIRDNTNTTTRLGAGTAGQVLTITGGIPAWQNATSGAQGAISVDKLKGIILNFGPLVNGNLLQYDGLNFVNVTPASLGSITLATGSTGSDVNVSGSPIALGQTLTLNIPDAGSMSRGLVTTGTQTFAGDKIFSGNLAASANFATSFGTNYATTGVQNDVNLGSGSVFRYIGAGNATFTGFTGGTVGREIRIVNESSFSIILSNNDSNSSAADRIITTTGANLTIPGETTVDLQYIPAESSWHVVGVPATSTSIGIFAFIQGGNAFAAPAIFGTTDAYALNLITAGNTRFTLSTTSATLTGNGATTLTSNNTLSLSSGDTFGLTLDSGTTGALNIGTSSNAKTITIGNSTGVTAFNLKSGTGSQTFTSSNTTGAGISSAFVLNAWSLTSGTALRLTSSGTSGLLLDQNATNTSGTIDKLAYGAGTTLVGATTGFNLDLNTNVLAACIGQTGLAVATAADTNINRATKKGLQITSGTIIQNTATATGLYIGADVSLPALTLTSGTSLTGNGLRVTTGNITQTVGTIAENGLLVDSTGSTITTGGTINGVTINGPTTVSSVGTYNNLSLGTSTNDVANTQDKATIAVGNIPSTAQNNFATLNITNGGTGYLDVELMKGFINFRGMNTLYDDFTGRVLNTTNTWVSTVTGGGTTCGLLASGVGGLLRMTTGNAANRGCELTTGTITTLTNGIYQTGNNPIFETRLKIDTVANARIAAGFTDRRIAVASDTLTASNHAYLLKRSSDTAWQCVTDDGGAAETITPTGVTIVAGTFYRLRVEVRNGTTPEAICTVDDGTTVTRVTDTTHLPGATSPMDVYVRDNQSDIVVKNMDVDYVRTWQDDPVSQGLTLAANSSIPSVTPSATPMPVAPITDDLAALLGTVSAVVNLDGTNNGFSLFVTDIQKEVSYDPIAFFEKKIADNSQFLTDFIAARVTAIRGYFDEVFANKIHVKQICLTKSDGNEVCVNGDQADTFFQSHATPIPTLPITPTEAIATPTSLVPSPTIDVTSSNTASSSGQ